MKVSHNWLKEYLGENIPAPEAIEALLNFHAFEVEETEVVGDDEVIDIDILPNRSSDCLCHRGIAREIATLTDTTLVLDPLANDPALEVTEKITVKIEDEVKCPRFTATLITGIEVGESPDWLKSRLETIGQRSINNIVDATNYVMLALGQPLHAYDADKFPQVDGAWQFGVRTATAGEVISLLAEGGKDEDRDVELKGSELLIIDESSGTPIGLAGVKGGRFAGVDERTKNIIVEAAHFDPVLTRKTARALGIVIDASKRFENEPSRALPPYAQAEIVKLITKIAGGSCEGMLDEYLLPHTKVTAHVSPDRANALLGLSLNPEEMVALLMRAGIAAELTDGIIIAAGPFERTDLQIEEDFIEEIGRIYGYDNVTSVVPEAVPLLEHNARHYYSEQIREVLLAQGFSEVITSSFRKKDQVQLKNALSSDKSYLRSSLVKNITEVLDANNPHNDLLGTSDTRVFEIGTVFEKEEAAIAEHVSVAIGVRIKPSGYSGKEDKVLNEICSMVSETHATEIKWSIEKGVAECNLTELLKTLPAPTEYKQVHVGEEIEYKPFSHYPAMSRDIAMWTEGEIGAAEIENVLNETAGELRVRTTLFDEFEKDNRKSYAFRLVFQAMDRTLTDEIVNSTMDEVYKAIEERGWEAR